MRAWAAIVRACAAAAAIIILAGSPALRPWRESIFNMAAPILSTTRSVASWFRGLGGYFPNARVRALEAERERLASELAGREGLAEENKLLREALSLRRAGEAGVLAAEVIAFLREGRDEFIVLNRGTADGIGIGDIVVNKERVLGGTVVEVAPRASRAILLASASRSIDVVVGASRLRAIARGSNARELAVELVPQGAALGVGDAVLATPRATGGRGFLAVGEVREAREAEHGVFKTVRALHLFDPAEDGVLVLLAP